MIILSLAWMVNPNMNLIDKIYYYVRGSLYERFMIENIFFGWNKADDKWNLGVHLPPRGSNEPLELAKKRKRKEKNMYNNFVLII